MMGTADFMIGPASEQVQQLQAYARAVKAQWFSEDTVTLIFLAGTPEQKLQLRRADALYQNIELSLRFNQAHRAARYLAAYCTLCRQLFSPAVLDAAREKLAE